jgi:fatty acid-binding protein DegV
MSEQMSASFENCRKAADRIRAEYPGQQLYVMDTRCVSGGLGLLVMKMVEMKENGADFDEVIRWGEEN